MNALTVIVGLIVGIGAILLVYNTWLNDRAEEEAQKLREARERHPATRWQKLRQEVGDE